MTRYFFNIHDGTTITDDRGAELRDLTAARHYALVNASELLRDAPDTFWTGEEWKMEVADEQGVVLFTLVFSAIDAAGAAREG